MLAFFTAVFFRAAFFSPAFFAEAFFTVVFTSAAFLAVVCFVGALLAGDFFGSAEALGPTLGDADFLVVAAFFPEDFATTGSARSIFPGEAFLATAFFDTTGAGTSAGAGSTTDAFAAGCVSAGELNGSSGFTGVADSVGELADASTTGGSVASTSSEAISLPTRSKSIIDEFPIWCKRFTPYFVRYGQLHQEPDHRADQCSNIRP
ncbi:hypothetical protein [Variovorax sp. GT1P44]|uniref:hypothetical protein n=1 Tax=Variovorax sp. GT1P44 TaxID=3443742 RepID=UPI003F478C4D